MSTDTQDYTYTVPPEANSSWVGAPVATCQRYSPVKVTNLR